MEIDAKTKMFAVIGDPIEHSISPQMHNAVFERLGLNCAYGAFNVKPEDIGDAVRGFRALGFGGVNVTIPHKVSCMEHLDGLSEEARIIGAVNTLEFTEGKVIGHNTDGIGALNALKEGGADPEGKMVVLLGSGGAGRAIAVTLALRGNIKALTILGVVEDELERLLDDIVKNTGAEVEGAMMTDGTKAEAISEADILIHATPVGMHPKVDETLVTSDLLRPDMSVMDIVYNPRRTRLLKEAEKAGCSTIEGLGMFVGQGAEAERIWLGINPPVDLMREVVARELGV
jgi:shikimate dehydrogenase